jgi:hypothetical protein
MVSKGGEIMAYNTPWTQSEDDYIKEQIKKYNSMKYKALAMKIYEEDNIITQRGIVGIYQHILVLRKEIA